jgi:hypothetical protein
VIELQVLVYPRVGSCEAKIVAEVYLDASTRAVSVEGKANLAKSKTADSDLLPAVPFVKNESNELTVSATVTATVEPAAAVKPASAMKAASAVESAARIATVESTANRSASIAAAITVS